MSYSANLFTKIAVLSLVLGVLVVPFAHAADLTSRKDTLTRLKVSTTADHTVGFVLPTGTDFDGTGTIDVIRVDFPSGFSQSGTWVTGDFTFNDGTARTVNAVAQGTTTTDVSCSDGANNVGVAIDTDDHIFYIKVCGSTYTASATGATIAFTIDGTSTDGTLTNPASAATAGSQHTVSLAVCNNTSNCTTSFTATDSGSIALAIVDDDQVTISATVDPSIVFDLDTATSNANSSTPYSVALGTLTTASVTSSNLTTETGTDVNAIWVDIDTNAEAGAVITVVSLNGASGLVSSSVPGDTIGSSTGVIAAGAEGYGICVTESGSTGAPAATTGTLTPVSPFNSSACDDDEHNVGGLTTSAQNILNTSAAPIAGGRAAIRVKAAISAVTEAHTDYTDTLTFIATGTF